VNTVGLVRLVTVACVLVLLLATWPQLVWLERFPVMAQLTALRGLLVLSGAAGALIFGFLAWRSPSWRRSATVLTAGLIVVAAANLWIMSNRGFEVSTMSVDATDLTVFVWNVYRDGPDPALIADFALTNGVDVIALLEVGPSTVNQIAGSMGQAGRPMQAFTLSFHQPQSPRYTALLISETLGEYAQDFTLGSTVRVPSVVAQPKNGSGPTLIAGHAAPPLPWLMRNWAEGLQWLAERCTEDDVIMFGDFNATLDHFSRLRSAGNHVGDCRDAAQSLGGGSLATWPSQLPMFLGSPIDHVVASSEWEFSGYRIVKELDGQGSDHRALLVQLRRVS
jgi:endonuclease/exonuclease/phosphatase (EEP) superfamily protein YafD